MEEAEAQAPRQYLVGVLVTASTIPEALAKIAGSFSVGLKSIQAARVDGPNGPYVSTWELPMTEGEKHEPVVSD